jgi:Asp-tRNA(Asn)/Glu-tRNA(Gln) amidotransferase A subunit family amidase
MMLMLMLMLIRSLFIAGFSPATPDAPKGVPIGLELMGREGGDEVLLELAELIEGILSARQVSHLN